MFPVSFPMKAPSLTSSWDSFQLSSVALDLSLGNGHLLHTGPSSYQVIKPESLPHSSREHDNHSLPPAGQHSGRYRPQDDLKPLHTSQTSFRSF